MSVWQVIKVCGVWAALMLSLVACGPAPVVAPTDADVLAAEQLRPANRELAALYERSCVACHGVRSAAPLTGHAPSWQPRLQQGEEVLLAHTREGMGGMPAMGLCADCSDAQLQDLISFMSRTP